MAQLWGGRFTKATDQLVYDFNASIGFDQRFFAEDIMGSKAHVKMLAKQGILTEEERDEILVGLEGIEKDVADGKLAITSEYEDIHSFVEANLIDRIGDPGQETAYRTQQKRSGGIGYAPLYQKSGRTYQGSAPSSA